MIKKRLKKNLLITLKKIGVIADKNRLKNLQINIEGSTNEKFGDYTTNIALQLAKELKKSPLEIAKDIVNNLNKDRVIKKIEIIKPGFINFWLSENFLLSQLKKINEKKIIFPIVNFGKNKKIIIEFGQPNTHKLFHIGHLRNISIGESLARIFETVGNKVIRANYQGDVGLHIAKCLWAIKKLNLEIENLKTLKEKIDLIGKSYTYGTKEYETNPRAKEEILKINEMIYNQDQKIFSLWQKTRQWSLDYFDKIYQRVDSHFDRFYFESQLAKRGLEIVKKAKERGILEESQKAIIFNGKKYRLDTRVFVNSLGFPTYEGKELALAEKEFSDFGEIDKCIHVVTPEQKSFFQVTFKVEELLNEKKYKGKQYHLAYNWVSLKTGKMSSREGNIVEANWLIDKIKKEIITLFKCPHKIAETIAVASVKYSFLKKNTLTPIVFDFKESISLEGNSAPYLLYAYVRTQSILKQINLTELVIDNNPLISPDEFLLLRLLHRFPETVENAAKNLAPNLIADYLFKLTKQFNLFYQKYPVLKAKKDLKNFRLSLTKATGEILRKGLYLLGIKTVKEM